jgi:REP element-mobilizing transposase RayT
MVMFRRDSDFEAFERIMQEAYELHPIRILSYCLMSNHWHFVVWPERDGQVTDFFRWLTHTHAMRWRVTPVAVQRFGSPARLNIRHSPSESQGNLPTFIISRPRGTPAFVALAARICQKASPPR